MQTIGELISDAAGAGECKDGVITVEESKSMEATLEVVERYAVWTRGYLSKYKW